MSNPTLLVQPAERSFAKLYKDNAQGIEIERLKMRIEELEAQPEQPAQRVPMTDEQVEDMRGEANRGFNIEREDYAKAVRDTEAFHGIGAKP